MRYAWVFALGVLLCASLGACLGDQRAGQTDAVIHVLCTCSDPPLPKAQELCVEKLSMQLPVLPQNCIDCILANANSCSTLMQVCDNDCQQPQPTERETR